MSINQLADPSVKTALGFGVAPSPADPTLAYTTSGTTSTLRVGSVTNTVPITQVPILNYDAQTTLQPSPIPIDIRLDPPNASPLNNVRIAEFHWIKEDQFGNQDKYGYFNLGDGFFKIGSEWAGQGPQGVVLEGEVVVINAIGNQVGGTGLELQGGGDGSGINPPQASGRFFLDTAGQLNFVHLLPTPSIGNQVLFFPTNCEAASLATTPVGGGGSVVLPFTNILTSTEQNSVKHFALNGTGVQYVGTSSGQFFVTASVSLDTTSGGFNAAITYFTVNGTPIQFSACRHTINQNQNQSVIIQTFLTLNPNDTIEIVLASADPNMTATDFPAVPPLPEQPAVLLVATRIA